LADLARFRADTATWLQANCPQSLRRRAAEPFAGGTRERLTNPDARCWLDAMVERGWTVPGWPQEYGGAGLDREHQLVLRQEMARIGAPAPLGGMGVMMIGPTLLEHGNADQKQRHLPKIARGDVRWCQGYSEPGAGSDLAALSTRAEDHGDYYLVNGSKIWTSGAQYADWIFCLVRTDPNAPKHDGISFLLFAMDSPGVSVKPIVLISGQSPFCQCFFDDVKVPKADLVGLPNRGWTIAKRLLQHERGGLSGLSTGSTPQRLTGAPLESIAKDYVGTDDAGRIANPDFRREVTAFNMASRAFALTQRRAQEENTGGGTPTFATSIFKYVSSELAKRRQELALSLLGTRGIGWSEDAVSAGELETTRAWLRGKAGTIAGGSSEIQLNIVAKRVLGLPD
jgi:alkylation response protein AidB-like acyl-CoA dehydrogenase